MNKLIRYIIKNEAFNHKYDMIKQELYQWIQSTIYINNILYYNNFVSQIFCHIFNISLMCLSKFNYWINSNTKPLSNNIDHVVGILASIWLEDVLYNCYAPAIR